MIVHMHTGPCPHCSRYWWARISLAMLCDELTDGQLDNAIIETLSFTPPMELS